MKRLSLSPAMMIVTGALTACASHTTSGAIRSADYANHAQFDKWRFYSVSENREDPERYKHRTRVLTEPPQAAFVVVGTVEVRSSRPVAISDLVEEVRSVGQRSLHADAVMPPRVKKREDGDASSSANPLRRFYVFDDGRTQVLEAEAIRFAVTLVKDIPPP